MMSREDDDELKIYYPCGICSLWQLIRERLKYGKSWENKILQIYELLDSLYTKVLLLDEKQLYHSDIKSENIVIEYDVFNDKLIYKLIDFGSLSNNYKEINSYTENYFCNELVYRNKNAMDNYIFETRTRRVKAELYCVNMVILDILFTSISSSLKEIHVKSILYSQNKERE